VKVLECHAFICTSEQSANALVRSCFHSYADTAFLRIDDKLPNNKAIKNGSLNERADSPNSEQPTTDDNRDDIDWEERAIGRVLQSNAKILLFYGSYQNSPKTL
jgi:hypothetical protein